MTNSCVIRPFHFGMAREPGRTSAALARSQPPWVRIGRASLWLATFALPGFQLMRPIRSLSWWCEHESLGFFVNVMRTRTDQRRSHSFSGDASQEGQTEWTDPIQLLKGSA